MEEKILRPKIRFKGFNDDWEQCKLGNLGKTQSGVGFPDSEQGGQIGIPFYKVSDMNIEGNEHEMVTANHYVTSSQIAKRGWKPIDAVPAIMFAKVGAAVMLNRKRLISKPFLLDNNTMAYSFGDKLYSNFGKSLFDTIYLPSFVQVGALPSYNATDINEIEVKIPKLDEQAMIGSAFDKINNLITLHQRKYEKLKNIKNALLQKMFPKKGANIPEVRFKGFTDAWEQCELGSIAKLEVGKAFSNDLLSNGKYVVMDMGSVSQDGFRIENKRTNTLRDLLCTNDLIMPKDDIGGGLIIAKTAHIPCENKYVLGDHVYKLRFLNHNGLFMHYLINSDNVNRRIKMKVTGSAQLGIKADNVKNEVLLVPDIQEQSKIGELYRFIDNLITLHQRKYEKLKNIKKALLEKMFV